LAIEAGWFRYETIEFSLASGRKFRYQMRDYPFRVFASEAELDALCCKIIKDKYRYCEWDRAHPKTNSEVEIFDAVKKWMLVQVANAHELQAEFDAAAGAQPENG
jgi:hypothetical protein